MKRIEIDGVKYEYNATHSPLDLEKIKIKLHECRSFANVFRNDLTRAFDDTMKSIVNPLEKHEENTIWNVRGDSGSGKSLMTISLSKKYTPKTFTYKNVVFYDQHILDIAKDMERDSFAIRDEAVKVFGTGSTRIATDLVTLSETCRKFGINLAFLSPSDREIPVAKHILDVIDKDYDKRITRVGLKDPSTDQYLGAVYVKVLDNDDYDWIEYNKAKDKFIDEIKDGKRAGKSDFRSIAKEMYKKIDENTFRTMKQRLAYLKAELNALTNSEIEIVGTFLEILIRHGEEALDNKDKEDKEDEP
jgi:ABC-type dipeptide/oligopeptide/nickel transport system ATPase component